MNSQQIQITTSEKPKQDRAVGSSVAQVKARVVVDLDEGRFCDVCCLSCRADRARLTAAIPARLYVVAVTCECGKQIVEFNTFSEIAAPCGEVPGISLADSMRRQPQTVPPLPSLPLTDSPVTAEDLSTGASDEEVPLFRGRFAGRRRIYPTDLDGDRTGRDFWEKVDAEIDRMKEEGGL